MRKTQAFLFTLLLLLLNFCGQPARQPDEVRLRLAIDPGSLSPINYSSQEALQIINLLYQSLLTVDLEDNTLKPGLASSFPEVERKDSLTFFHYQLRPEAEWPDGSPVTAQDVAFTLKVLKSPFIRNEYLRAQIEFIQDIQLDSSNPSKFTLVCQGYTPEMQLLTGDFFILPSYLLDPQQVYLTIPLLTLSTADSSQYNTDRTRAVAARCNKLGSPESKEILQGSAGYQLAEWASGQHVVLKRKENWWGKNTGDAKSYLTANPAQINFQIIPDNTTAHLALKNAQLDVLDNIPVNEFEQLRQDDNFLKNYGLHTPQGYDLIYAAINTRKPKFSDRRTRQAIAHLMDVPGMIRVSQQSYATPTVGPVPPDRKDLYHAQLPMRSYSPEKAIALLKAAGWIQEQQGWYRILNGQREELRIELLYRAGNTMYEQMALIFQQHAMKTGIPVTLLPLEGNVYSQKIDQRDYDMHFRGLSGNPFVFNFKPLFHTSFAGPGGLNSTGFGTPESDQILNQINETESEVAKARLLHRLQEIIQEEAAFVPLYFRKERIAIHSRFSNTKVSGVRPYYDLSSFMLKP
ncbi:ABC transporter substrate-binding protein [Pontibacter ramchanderi]|uniref:Peptide/nickel transport system substrate-binding protein n=1 Tax=Pontibacter ramchanderi TaxID=1179743 RepID=A0A2N3V2J8_9BACT|nr:ABC transporter substrate-binding protein [Pontibacter ramchanderi]PKV75816.1 peptide/nickel transport system substrate-binding protein [Pontibacter ramchanderi]